MHTRTQVLFESRQAHFGRFNAAADRWTALKYKNFKTAFGQISGADQAVMARARDNEIETLARGSLFGHRAQRCQGKGSQSRSFYEAASRNHAHLFFLSKVFN